jgi:hypothetical protein
MVVTEWQVDLDARLDKPTDSHERELEGPDLARARFGSGMSERAVRSWTGHEREDAHVALEIDPADEGVSQP